MISFSPLRRALAAAAVGSTLLLALAGCLKIDLDVAVSNDDKVSGTYVYALFDDTGSIDGSTIEALSADEYVAAEEYSDGTYVGKKYTITNQPIDLFFGTNMTQAALSIYRDGDDLVVSGSLDLTDTDTDAAAVEERRSQADVRVRITLPGDIYEADGSISGNTITWVGEWDENTPINARSFAPLGGGSSSPSPIATESSGATASPTPSDSATDGALTDPLVDMGGDLLDSAVDTAAAAFWSSIAMPLIIGAVVFGVLILIVIVLLIVFISKRKKTANPPAANPTAPAATPAAAPADPAKTQVLPQQPGE